MKNSTRHECSTCVIVHLKVFIGCSASARATGAHAYRYRLHAYPAADGQKPMGRSTLTTHCARTAEVMAAGATTELKMPFWGGLMTITKGRTNAHTSPSFIRTAGPSAQCPAVLRSLRRPHTVDNLHNNIQSHAHFAHPGCARQLSRSTGSDTPPAVSSESTASAAC
jgi:hypothetical protein